MNRSYCTIKTIVTPSNHPAGIYRIFFRGIHGENANIRIQLETESSKTEDLCYYSPWVVVASGAIRIQHSISLPEGQKRIILQADKPINGEFGMIDMMRPAQPTFIPPIPKTPIKTSRPLGAGTRKLELD